MAKQLRHFVFVVLFATLLVGQVPTAAFAAADWDVPGGHFFTQTGGGIGND